MKLSPFPLVVFDLDGTIADSAPDLAAALNAALVSLGRAPQSLEAVRGMIGHGTRALLRNGLAATGGCDEALVTEAYPVLLAYYEAHICDLTMPYPGVEQAWDDLAAQSVRLALCTNKPAALTDKLLAALGWQQRFAAVVGGDTLGVSKPDPAPLHLAIAQAGGGPAAFVGDSIVDIETAKAAGVPSIAVSFGFADRPAHELGADAVIDGYGELIAALVRLSDRPAD
jgi:phosphoglycolate phosphatase